MLLVVKRNAGFISCGLITLLVTSPVWLIRFAPLHDLPFHAARMAILHDVIYGGRLDRFYNLNSLFIPNSAIDCVVLLLSILFTIESSCRILVIAICFLIIYGMHFINSSLFKYDPIIILIAALLTYNSVFTLGLLNYLAGLGLLLLAVGLQIRIRNRNAAIRLVVGSLAALVLFLAHIVAFVLYAIVIAGLEVQAVWNTVKTAPTAAIERLMISGFPILLILALFYLLSPTSDAVGGAINFGGPSLAGIAKFKLWVARTMFAGRQNDTLDLAQTLFAGSLVIAFLILGRVRVAKEAYLALALLCLSFVLAPDAALGGSFLLFRLPIAIAFVSVAFTEFAVGDVRIHRAFVAVLIAGLLLRTAVVAHDWWRFRSSSAAIHRGL